MFLCFLPLIKSSLDIYDHRWSLCGLNGRQQPLTQISAAQFIVFREKRKMDLREILREKWATKNSRKNAEKKAKKLPVLGPKLTFSRKIVQRGQTEGLIGFEG